MSKASRTEEILDEMTAQVPTNLIKGAHQRQFKGSETAGKTSTKSFICCLHQFSGPVYQGE
jgi:hypothetical protein